MGTHHEAELTELRTQLEIRTPQNPAAVGWKTFAQCDEDGILRECLDRIASVVDLSHTCFEIGCGDGLENNTHQLLLDGFTGCWVDGDPDRIERLRAGLGGECFPQLWVREAMVHTRNAAQLARDAADFLGGTDIDLLSLDIDGPDLHVARGLLDVLDPKLICVEYNAKFPPPIALAIADDPAFIWQNDDYFGASLTAWVEFFDGYRLVACNLSGANAFFVRADALAPFADHSIDALYQPARYHLASVASGHPPSLGWLRQSLRREPQPSCDVLTVAAGRAGRFEFEVHQVFDEYVSGDIRRDRTWEPFETDVFNRIIETGDIVVDIGANIGWYTVVFSRLVGPRGSVFAFEPEAANRAILERNLARSAGLGTVHLSASGIGADDGEGAIYLSPSNMGDHRLYGGEGLEAGSSIEIRSLDSVFGDSTDLPTVVKSDTQGFECQVLEGAADLLGRGWRPTWLLEFWPYGLDGAGADPQWMIDRLTSLDYDLFEVHELRPELVRITPERLAARLATDISVEAQGFINVLALPRDSDRLAQLTDLVVEL